MKKRYVGSIIAVLVVAVAVGLIFSFNGSGNNSPGPSGNVISTPVQNSTQAVMSNNTIITPEELSKHNTLSDCWVAYNGSVYNLSPSIPKHPGGEQVFVPLCGTSKKFQEAFTKEHGTSKVAMLKKSTIFEGYFKE